MQTVAQVLAEEYRGEILDLVHHGYICVVDKDNRVVASAGDPEQVVFYRSASKPFQALPVIARGLDREYGLTEEETVIFAGSHLGEDFHVAALRSIFAKTGMNPEDLIMKPTVPGSREPTRSGFAGDCRPISCTIIAAANTPGPCCCKRPWIRRISGTTGKWSLVPSRRFLVPWRNFPSTPGSRWGWGWTAAACRCLRCP
ncbi:MAG TPA: asparaginase [Candidatus Faecousia excrementipullorum]|nr:asparaginase [Candidatus Faecousia excrementipullorum]